MLQSVFFKFYIILMARVLVSV